MWNYKTLKTQRTFQNWSKILELQKFLPHINGVKCTWCVKKIVVYYIRKHKNVEKNINYLWFEIIIIFKDKTLNLQGIKTFSDIHIYSKTMKKKHVMYWTTINIYYYKPQKKLFQNSFIWKSFFCEKGHEVIFYSNPIGSLYPICTQMILWMTKP
jgi:hypothetical protein